jgi:hypothetical protein
MVWTAAVYLKEIPYTGCEAILSEPVRSLQPNYVYDLEMKKTHQRLRLPGRSLELKLRNSSDRGVAQVLDPRCINVPKTYKLGRSDDQFVTLDGQNRDRLKRSEPKFYIVFKGRWCRWEIDESNEFGWGKKTPAPSGKGIGLYGMFQRHHGVSCSWQLGI